MMLAVIPQELTVPSNSSISPARRRFIKQCSLLGLASTLPAGRLLYASGNPSSATSSVATPPVKDRAPLNPGAFFSLPLGSIRPTGWLRGQLQIQANGLSGHLDETWPGVGPNSGWLGGTGESWERGPYFLDGLLPLAYLLDDPRLKAKAQKYVEWTLTHQAPNGMIGPASNNDWWPRIVMLKALTQYQEATADPRVLPLMDKYFRYQLAELPIRPLRDWSKFRWQDELLSVIWLYNRTGSAYLLDLAHMLKKQGYDWQAQYADFKYKQRITAEFIDLELYRTAVRTLDLQLFQVDRDDGVGAALGIVHQLVHDLLRQHDRQDAVLETVAIKDVGEARRDHAADAEIQQGPRRMLAA